VSQEVDAAAGIGVANPVPASGFTQVAQSFTTGTTFTQVGYVGLFLKKTGNGCDLSLSICANSGGVPGAAQTLTGGVTAVTLPADFVTTSLAWVYVPVPISGLAASTTYWIVASAGDVNGANDGDASDFITVEKSTQVTGAATFGTAWASVAYGFMFRVFDQSFTDPLTLIYEDGGARWSYLSWDATSLSQVQTISEYTIAQVGGQMRSVRTASYSGTEFEGWS
jgi:hypothetical protein